MRRIHLARQRDLLRRGELDFWGRLWHRIIGITVGYGYRPTTALLWWAGTLALSVLLIVGVAGPAGLVNRTTATGGQLTSCSPLEQIGLALNTATPLVKSTSEQPLPDRHHHRCWPDRHRRNLDPAGPRLVLRHIVHRRIHGTGAEIALRRSAARACDSQQKSAFAK
jgi:hypothetical protein